MPLDANDIHRKFGAGTLRGHFDGAASDAEDSLPLRATPYEWIEPHALAPRRWLLGRHLCRGTLSVTVSPGGTGKSALALCEAISLASGQDLLGEDLPDGATAVWYWNLEDSRDELSRRIQAICQHYRIGPKDFDGRLFIDTGVEQPMDATVLSGRDFSINTGLFETIEVIVRRNRIDALIIDPFVSSHSANENDNGQMDRVAKAWAGLAARANIAVSIVHHTRKSSGDGQVNTESARGAKALTDAARAVRVLERASADNAASFGIEHPAGLFSSRLDKQNFGVAQTDPDWFQMVGIRLANGDEVGVVERFNPPDSTMPPEPELLRAVQARCAQEVWGANVQALDWVGKLVGELGGFDAGARDGNSRAKHLLKCWIAQGHLTKASVYDSGKARDRPIVRPGNSIQAHDNQPLTFDVSQAAAPSDANDLSASSDW